MCSCIETLSTSTPVARKEYNCSASEWLREMLSDYPWTVNHYNMETKKSWLEFKYMTFTEKRAVVIARRNKWRIRVGQQYLSVRQIHEGHFCTFRAIPEIHAICNKYDLYECVC